MARKYKGDYSSEEWNLIKAEEKLKRIKKAKVKKVPTKEELRNYQLKVNYGISSSEYNIYFVEQDGCCKICGKHQVEFKKKLNVDHDHKTGKIRGLLCATCNMGLGMFKDKVELLKKAILYLEDINIC